VQDDVEQPAEQPGQAGPSRGQTVPEEHRRKQ
jgi:hypothetical protein